MSETRTRGRLADPMRDDLEASLREAQGGVGSDMLPALTPRAGGAATDQALAGFVTAQKVAIKRDFPRILAEGKAVAAAAGDRFFYRIPFKQRDKATGETKTTFVEGPSINLAMAAVSLYGNCKVAAVVEKETQDAWTFAAQFQDLEKGVTIVRSFQQRKGQNTGMRDGGRQLDIVFQIGQSKAMRNVIVAALPLLVSEMHEAAKDSLLSRIAKNPDAARSWVLDRLDQRRISIKRVERMIARAQDKWTAADMARIVADLNAIADGVATADDLWPLAPGETAATEEETGDRTMTEAAAAESGAEEPEEEAEPAQQQEEQAQPQEETPPAEDEQAAAEPEPEPSKEDEKPQEEEKPKPAASTKPAKDAKPAAPKLEFQ